MNSRLFPVVLRNRDLVQITDLQVNVASPSLQYGEGLFEGVMAYPNVNGGLNVVALRQHLERMFDSALAVYPAIKVPVTISRAMIGIQEMLRANQVAEQAYIRPSLLMPGPGDLHGEPIDGNREFLFSAYAQPCSGFRKPGLRCVISPLHKPSHLVFSHKLCGNYVYLDMAHNLAAAEGYDEGILLDETGLVAEGVYQNMLIEDQSGVLITPSRSERPILPSITLRVVRRLAGHHFSPSGAINAANVRPEDLLRARSVLMLGTASEVNHVREITWGGQSHLINNGEPTHFARHLIDLYGRFVRGELGHEDLLFRV